MVQIATLANGGARWPATETVPLAPMRKRVWGSREPLCPGARLVDDATCHRSTVLKCALPCLRTAGIAGQAWRPCRFSNALAAPWMY